MHTWDMAIGHEAGMPNTEDDSLKRLWRQTRAEKWHKWAHKTDLRPLATVLPAHERILGVCRIPWAMNDSGAFTVTDQNVYLSCCDRSVHWEMLCESLPARFLVNDQVFGVPVEAVISCRIENSAFVLQIDGESAVTIDILFASVYGPVVERFMQAARRSLRGV
jgi:hypothetical protein